MTVCTVLASPFVVEHVENAGSCPSSGHHCKIPVYNSSAISWRRGCCVGYSVEIFEMVKRELGFEYDLYVVEDNKFGSLGDNNSWNGMVGELVEGRADFALQALSITSLRQSVVDFTGYVLTSNYGMIRTTQNPNKEEENTLDWSFATVLSPLLATAILVSTVLVIAFTFVHENMLNWMFSDGGRKKGSVYFPIREVLTYTVGLCFQRDMGGTNPRKWSGRFVALGYAAAMTVVMSSYTARITVSSISNVEKTDFKGFYSDEVGILRGILR